MTPMKRVALGLVVVILDISWSGWDLLADPLGWGLVLAGVLPVLDHLGRPVGLAAALAALASLVAYPPAVADAIGPAGGWLLSLPHLLFCILLCLALARRLPDAALRLARLGAALAAVAIAPLLAVITGTLGLLPIFAGLAVAAQLYLIWLLIRFSASLPSAASDDATGASGPTGPAGPAGPETREGPPPSGSGPVTA